MDDTSPFINHFPDRDTTYMTQIWRQRSADGEEVENPIISIAQAALSLDRTSIHHRIDEMAEKFPDKVAVYESLADVPKDDLRGTSVLCWRNVSRGNAIHRIRSELGYSKRYFEVGELLTVVKTRRREYRDEGVHKNTMLRIDKINLPSVLDVTIVGTNPPVSFTDVMVSLEDDKALADSKKYRQHHDGMAVRKSDQGLLGDISVRFGCASTTHTAQGGETDRVIILLDDILANSYPDKNFPGSNTEPGWRRLLYTSVTRASDRLIFVNNVDPKNTGMPF